MTGEARKGEGMDGGGGGAKGWKYSSRHTCMHAYVLANMHTYIHAYMHACMHTCIHAYMRTNVHTTYVHTYSAEQAQCRTAEHSARRTRSLDPHVCTAAMWISFSCPCDCRRLFCTPHSSSLRLSVIVEQIVDFSLSQIMKEMMEVVQIMPLEFVQNRTMEQQRTFSFSDPRCSRSSFRPARASPTSFRKGLMRKW